MKIIIEMTPEDGFHISVHISPIVLRVILLSLAGGAAAWPWLTQLVQALGWM